MTTNREKSDKIPTEIEREKNKDMERKMPAIENTLTLIRDEYVRLSTDNYNVDDTEFNSEDSDE